MLVYVACARGTAAQAERLYKSPGDSSLPRPELAKGWLYAVL